MGTSTGSNWHLFTRVGRLIISSIRAIKSVPKHNVRVKGRISSRRARNAIVIVVIIRLTGGGRRGHRFVMHSLGEQLIQIVILVIRRPVSPRLVGRTLRLDAEPLLASTLNVKGLREGKVRVVNAGVGEQEGHRHNGRQTIDVADNYKSDDDNGHGDHGVDGNLIGTALEEKEEILEMQF